MSRVKHAAKLLFYGACRVLARIVPPGVLYFLVLPYAALRGLRPAFSARDRHLPASTLPPIPTERPAFLKRWKYQTSFHQRWLPMVWSDSWDPTPWPEQITADDAAELDKAAKNHGLIILTVHTGGMIVLGSWLEKRGLSIGSVLLPENYVKAQQVWAQFDNKRTARYRDSVGFARGDARSMVRYMRPGRVMFLPADELQGYKTIDGAWAGGRVRLARGAFRIARMTDSVVVPMVAMDAGRWRYHIHIGAPVPMALVAGGDEQAAADHVAREIMPVVAENPKQAAPPLVWAVLQAMAVTDLHTARAVEEIRAAQETELVPGRAEAAV